MLNKILNNLKQDEIYNCYEINGKIYTNKQLYKYVCNIYSYILQNNVDKTPIIVYGHKDIYMIAGFLACAFAGVAYVPLDVSIPDERIDRIKKQIQPKIIIDSNITYIMEKQKSKDINKIHMQDSDTYYIIFTSGSTGEPKGVKISYANIKSCVKWLEDICYIKEGTILNQANFSFDLSVADIYLSLVTKSKHYILEKSIQRDYIKLFNELKNSKCNLMVATPSFIDLLLVDNSFGEKLLPSLNKILLCGEKLNSTTVNRLNERFENITIINSYGPTECTFAVTSEIVKQNENISIGVPKPDVNIYIVDENLNKLTENIIGEILIAGESVGLGYVDENKNENFFIKFEGKNAYLTGDLGYLKNNKYYILGRKDKQIKYNGYRIELGEIENAIYNLGYVQKCVIVTKKNISEKISRIIAFIELKKDCKIESKHIICELKKYLPSYMIPIIQIIDHIPLNDNGKVNEKKLLEE